MGKIGGAGKYSEGWSDSGLDGARCGVRKRGVLYAVRGLGKIETELSNCRRLDVSSDGDFGWAR